MFFSGEGSFRDGGDGKDLYIRVPVGTIIRKKDAQVTTSSSSSGAVTARQHGDKDYLQKYCGSVQFSRAQTCSSGCSCMQAPARRSATDRSSRVAAESEDSSSSRQQDGPRLSWVCVHFIPTAACEGTANMNLVVMNSHTCLRCIAGG
jgi:hypothetical protein